MQGYNDVIRIHARIGGDNWIYYDGPELSRNTWFVEKVDYIPVGKRGCQ